MSTRWIVEIAGGLDDAELHHLALQQSQAPTRIAFGRLGAGQSNQAGLLLAVENPRRLKARIVLMAAEGAATRAIGRALGCTTGTASKWRVRYAKDRLAGFSETGNRGAKAKYGEEAGRRILALLDQPPPAGSANWTGPLIAEALGDVHVQHVWRFLRAHKIDLSGRKSWCVSTDPEFAAKAAEIVALYMAPPDNAVVLAVDEKPSIQALERAQGYLKLPSGRAVSLPRIGRKITLKLVLLAIKFLGVRGRLAFDRDIRPDPRIFGVQLEPFFQVRFAIGQDCLGRTLGFAYAAVDALVRMDDQHVIALVETIDRAHLYAIHVFAFDAIVSDYVSHNDFVA